ncbi:NTP transferase domain-containing protein [Geothrix alkalitolerans]|uniref:NTP transferase domain-containing protein n=1 Tax=Geothrix alkalitolerans TaxID=2922724 RepID=UPI001FAEA38C|nr:NTP transferase domain-containing protein [Geothrix alkalitolerans]
MSSPRAGLLLLSGGQGRRMGEAKHTLAHPAGGSWGARLVQVFEAVFPGAPVQVLGEPLPDRPGLPVIDDPREGPARALQAWAALAAPAARRWWVLACDQVRWTPERLEDWAHRAEAADPQVLHWVMARHRGHLQPLGGWIATALRPAIADATSRSLMALAESLPHLVLPAEGPEWLDVDTPEERRAFEDEGQDQG